MKFPEKYKVVPVGSAEDMATTFYTNDINMSKYHHATFLVQLASLGTSDCTLTVISGATDGAHTTAETFNYAYGGAAEGTANCDVLSATTSVATLAITQTVYSNYLLVVEIDASSMTEGQEWLSLLFTDTGGSGTGTAYIVAILEPRYSDYLSATALT